MKKIIVLLTILSMLVGMLPTVSFAATTYAPITASAEKCVQGATIVDDVRSSIPSDGNKLIEFYTAGTNTARRGFVYYKFKLPTIPEGQTVTKASFNFRYGGYRVLSAYAPEYQLRFYQINTPWDDTIELGKMPLKLGEGNWPEATPDAVVDMGRYETVYDETVDITSMVRKHLASGSTEDFSFAIMPYHTAKSSYIYLWPSTASTNYPTITLETDVVSALDTISVTPAVATDDPVAFEFNNAIDASTVTATDFTVTDLSGETVPVTDGEFTVSGNTVTLNKTWENYGFYKVSLSGISDVYDQPLSGSRSTSFEISPSATTVTNNTLGAFYIAKSDQAVYALSKKTSTKNAYTLYKFDLSAIDTSKSVVSAKFKWASETKPGRTASVKVVPSGSWTDLVTLTSAVTSEGYYTKLDEAYNSDASTIDEVLLTHDVIGDYQKVNTITDVTEAVSKILSDDSVSTKHITFAFTSTGTWSFYHTVNDYTLEVSYADRSFDAFEASPAKGGVMNGVNNPIELTLATSIDKAFANTDNIKLVKTDDNSEADVTVSAKGPKLTITPVSDLDERSEYKVVLKGGIKDAFGNGLDSDKVIHRFTSGTALRFYDIKFTSDASPVYDSMAEISSYNPGNRVTAVAKFENTSSTNLDAIMIIAIYNSDNSLIEVDAIGGPACAPANQTTQYAKSITVPSDASDTYIKAFIWTDLEDIRPICEDKTINQAN